MSDLFFFKDDELIRRAKEQPWRETKKSVFKDVFSLSYSNVAAVEMTDEEIAASAGGTLLFDTECFSNYYLVRFRSLDGNKYITFEHPFDTAKLEWVMANHCIIGYNSRSYDLPMNQLALKGASVEQLYKASCEIIREDVRDYNFRKKYKLPNPHYDHIDLIEVAPLQGSLKLYSGRLHTKRMQDLPVDPSKPLTPEQKIAVHDYCGNDLDNTALLTNELEPALNLRVQMSKQYNVDLRSKSDAQIAEAVITSELWKHTGIKPQRPEGATFTSHRYRVPPYISYRTPILQEMLKIVRTADFYLNGLGKVILPLDLAKLRLNIGQCVYRMGIGGLHSSEEGIAHVADEDTLLLDRDVASYYPSIILNQCLYPKHLGQDFLTVYRSIVERRLKAKKEKNKIVADSLKITINGSFGKFGNAYSALYSPDLMIQVTITGQLSLLLLIEMIEDLGIPVVSANTDGVMIKCPVARQNDLEARVKWWEQLTGFETEETRYKAVYSRDVNNYFALKEKGDPAAKYLDQRLGFKVKGCYGERGSAGDSPLAKNAEALICVDAVMQLISAGKPIEQTIRECTDIRRFVTIRNVTGGARKSDVYLGKVIRWYYSTEMRGEINRATKGDKIPKTDGARPLMELPTELPTDIDYNRYIDMAIEILHEIAYYKSSVKASRRCVGSLFAEDGQVAYELNA